MLNNDCRYSRSHSLSHDCMVVFTYIFRRASCLYAIVLYSKLRQIIKDIISHICRYRAVQGQNRSENHGTISAYALIRCTVIVDAYEKIRIKLCCSHSPSGERHQTVLRSCEIHLHTGIILKLIHHSLSYGIVGITFQNTIDSLLSRVCTTMTRIYDNDYISVRILCRHITGA